MSKLTVDIPEELFTKLPKDPKSLKKIIEMGLKNLPSKKRGRGIVENSYGIEAVGSHELIQEVLEAIKYGE
jgi:hypothetical protein